MNNNLLQIKKILLSAIPYSVYKKYGQAWKGKVSDDWDYDDSIYIPDIYEWAKDEWDNNREYNTRNNIEQTAYTGYQYRRLFKEASEKINKNDYIINQDKIDKDNNIEPEYNKDSYEYDFNNILDELTNEYIEEKLEEEYRDFIDSPDENEYNEYIKENFNTSKANTINPNVQNVYKELFNGKERIILPLTFNKEQQFDNIFSKYYHYLIKLIQEYIPNVKKKPISTINNWELHDTEILKNRCVLDDQNRQVRIAKILSEVNKKVNSDYWEYHKDNFNKQINELLKEIDKTNNANDEVTSGYVVISRHPYDIAGQSTDRQWNSCQNIMKDNTYEEDEYNKYVLSTITMGGLVAYLVESKDSRIGNKIVNYKNKLMSEDSNGKHYDILNNPIARITIKPYIERNNEMDFDNPNWILQASKLYGDGRKYPTFINVVQEWLDDNWNDQIAKEETDYYFDKDNFYKEDPLYKNYDKKFG
jgi:hypothetical protein